MRWWFHAPVRPERSLPREWFWLEVARTVIGFAVLVVLVVLVVWLLRRALRVRPAPKSRARAILDERYARGELTREQYLAMRRDLERSD